MKPFQHKKPDSVYTQTITTAHGSTSNQLTFHSSDIRAEDIAATDPAVYAQAMYEAADEYLNGDEWREAMDMAFPSEVRPFRSQPTAPQIALMDDRSVTFDPRETYDGRKVDKGEAKAGSLVAMESPDVGILVSGRVSIFDHTVQFGFTERSMEQTAEKLLNDLELNTAAKIAESLEGQPSTVAFRIGLQEATEGFSSRTATMQAEAILDAIAASLDTSWGRDISEFGVLVPVRLRPILNRAAQRAGAGSIDDLVGTRVQVYSGPDRGIFLAPKGFALLSFREDQNGDPWKVELTRNSATQSWDLEISAVLDVMATAMVELKLGGSEWETTQVALPIVTQLILEQDTESKPDAAPFAPGGYLKDGSTS